MGKKSLKKDRGYITATEWQTEWGGHKEKARAPFKCLPFNCCAISFTPFEDPVSHSLASISLTWSEGYLALACLSQDFSLLLGS